MRRSDYAIPCGGCLCDQCANNVENLHTEAGEMREPCFSCDECRWYDGNTRSKDMWTETCERFRITEYHAERNQEQIRRKNRKEKKRNERIRS